MEERGLRDAGRLRPRGQGTLHAVDLVEDKANPRLGQLLERLDDLLLPARSVGGLGVPRIDGVEHPVGHVRVLDLRVDGLGDPRVTVAEHPGDKLQGDAEIDQELPGRLPERVGAQRFDLGLLRCGSKFVAQVPQGAEQLPALPLGVPRHVSQEQALLIGHDRNLSIPSIVLRPPDVNADVGLVELLREIGSKSTVKSGILRRGGQDEGRGGSGIPEQVGKEPKDFLPGRATILRLVTWIERRRDDGIKVALPSASFLGEPKGRPQGGDLLVDAGVLHSLGPAAVDVAPDGSGILELSDPKIVAKDADEMARLRAVEANGLGAAVLVRRPRPTIFQEKAQGVVERRFRGKAIGISGFSLP